MAKLDRRTFLKSSAAAAVGASLGVLPRSARAAVWGEIPENLGLAKFKILDLIFPGGISQWESFWVSHDDGVPNWRGLEEYVANVGWLPGPYAPSHSLETKPFAPEIEGVRPAVSWGPATKPLWRSDIFERCRMLVTSHGHEVHELAAHEVLTGRSMGQPRAASLGAPIQRHFQSLASPLSIPYAYVFEPAASQAPRTYFMTDALLNGQHPGPSRPLGLRVGKPIGDLLTRNDVSPQADAVFAELRQQYRSLLRFQGSGAPVRSAAFDAYDGAAHYLVNAQQLDALLGGDELDADPVSPPVHLDAGAVANPTGRSLELAAKMFANGARHVTVMDGSFNDDVLRDAADLPYDCHHRRGEKDLVEITSVGVFGALSALASLIAVPGHLYTLPTIDLDSTLIRIFTEFGREPNPGIYGGGGAAIASSGREHFGTATLMVLIGGPVTQRGIQGSITTAMSGLNTADVSDPLTPTDVYAALLLAAGVDPFASDNLTSGDNFSPLILDEGISPATLRMRLKEQVLGVAP